MLNPSILHLANTLNTFHPRTPVSYLQVANYFRNASMDIIKRVTREIEQSLGSKGLTPDAIKQRPVEENADTTLLLIEVKGVPSSVGHHFIALPLTEMCKARIMMMANGCHILNVSMVCDELAEARYIALPYGTMVSDMSSEEVLSLDRQVENIVLRVGSSGLAFSKIYDIGGSPSGFLTETVPLESIYEATDTLIVHSSYQ